MKRKLLSILLALCMVLTLLPAAALAEDSSIDFDSFVKLLTVEDDGNVTYDGSNHEKAAGGKLTVKWSPVSGCSDNRGGSGHTCTVGNVAATGNTPNRVNGGNAQYQILYSTTSKVISTVTIKNVNFVYEAKDFVIYANSGWAGSFAATTAPNAQIYLGNTGDTVIENCSFDRVVFTSYNNTGKTEVKDCAFSNVYDSYAIKDLGGSTASVTGCTFTNCGGAIMTESWNTRGTNNATYSSLTISGNTFTNVDVASTAATDKVGTRGVLQFADKLTFSTITLSSNRATNCGPIVRQLNPSAKSLICTEDNWTELQSLAGTGSIFTSNSTSAGVAMIGSTVYDTLAAAINAASSGDTIKLISNVTLSEVLIIEDVKNVVIDLNGYSIKPTDSFDSNKGKYLIAVKHGGSLTVADSSEAKTGSIDTGENSNIFGAIKLTITDTADNTKTAKLKITGGTIKGYYYGVFGNGSESCSNTEITIEGGKLSGYATNDSYAVYHPQVGTLTITDGEFTGDACAIEMRAGTLNISGGTFKSTATSYSYKANGNGTTTAGAAIAIAQHTTKKNISVTISGGTFEGVKALNESNPQANDPAPQVNISISGGTFTGGISITDDSSTSITGGSFTDLGNAVKYAASGATIKLAADVSSGSGVFVPAGSKTLTIDLDGHTYTVTQPVGSPNTVNQAMHFEKGNTITLKNGTVTANSSDITIMVQNYCDLTLEDVTLDATQGTNSVSYVSSNNCGTVNVTGSTTLTAKGGGKALDISYWPSAYPAGTSVTVNTTGTITGKIDLGLWGNNNTEESPLSLPVTSLLTITNVNHVGDIAITNGDNGTYKTGLTDEQAAALVKGSITGGTFTTDPSAYVASGYQATLSNGVYTVAAIPVIVIPVQPSTPSTPTVTVPVSSDSGSVTVKATVKDGTATVEISDKQIAQVAADGAGTVTVDLSALEDVSSVKLPAHVVEATNAAEGTGLTVVLPNGSVALDETALESVATGKDVTISVKQVPAGDLTAAQKAAVGDTADIALVVDVDLFVGGEKQSDFNGGKLTVSIPYTPKAGEDVSKLTVWFIKDDGTIENKGGHYDAESGCFVFETDHLSRYLLVSVNISFTDVNENAYYAKAVNWAVAQGIVTGISGDKFAPDLDCTRGQIVTMLWRAAGCPEAAAAAEFTDVSADAFYAKAVAWAVENGITTGISADKFAPDASCTRAQAVAFLFRYAAANGMEGVTLQELVSGFGDAEEVPGYALPAFNWALANGIVQGYNNSLMPNGTCVRGQIVTMLYRLLVNN